MIRILYVDDEQDLCEIVRIFLEHAGDFTVDAVTSAQEALARIRQPHGYDIVVSDYQMPEMDGIAFLKVVRSVAGTLPFILFTGRGREEIVIEALNEGADFYLQKGGDPASQFAELAHKIRRAVDLYRSEKRIVESEEKYRTLVENAGEIILVTQDGKIRYINRAGERISGRSAGELAGTAVIEFVYPDDRELVLQIHKRRMAGDPTIPSVYEFRIAGKDGAMRWVENRSATITWEGGPAAFNLLTDITERKEAEAQKLSILAAVAIPQFAIDKNHTVISWNRAIEAYTGVMSGDAIGRPVQSFRHLFYETDRPLMAEILVDRAMEKLDELYPDKYRKSPYVEGAYEGLDFFPNLGEKSERGAWMKFTASPIRDSLGNVTGAVETFEDVTRQKAFIRAREQQDRA